MNLPGARDPCNTKSFKDHTPTAKICRSDEKNNRIEVNKGELEESCL